MASTARRTRRPGSSATRTTARRPSSAVRSRSTTPWLATSTSSCLRAACGRTRPYGNGSDEGTGTLTEFFSAAIVGLGLAAVYTLLAQGVVLIYRGSGIVNFAHGTFAMTGAYVFWEITSRGTAPVVGIVGAVAAGIALGLIVQYGIMWPLRAA